MLLPMGLVLPHRALAASGSTVTVDPFTRDRVIFDSGAALGRNAADIPLSGTSDAPDGTQVMAEILDAETEAVVHPAVAIATVQGGQWAGSFPLVARNSAWLTPRVWISGSEAPKAQGVNRFGVGHIWAIWSQSMIHHLTRHENDASDVLPAPTITDSEAVQVVRPLAGDAKKDNRTAEFLRIGEGVYAGNTSVGSTALAAFAQEFIEARPGEKLLVVFNVLQGTGPRSLANDSDFNRLFDIDKALHDLAITEPGQQVGLVTHPWFASPSGFRADYPSLIAAIWLGRRADTGVAIRPLQDTSALFPAGFTYKMPGGGSVTIDRTARELYDWSYTRMANLGQMGAGPGGVSNFGGKLEDIRIAMYLTARGSLSDVYVSPYGIELYNISKFGLPEVEPKGDGGHPAPATELGRHQLARLLAQGMMQQAGLMEWEVPVYNRSYWDPDGEYMEVWFEDSRGNTPAITTERIARGVAPIEGFGLEVSNGGYINDQLIERSEIVNGRVRIYPDGLGRKFRGTDTVRPITGGAMTYAKVAGSETWMNVPVVPIGSANLTGVAMAGIFDPDDLIAGREALPA